MGGDAASIQPVKPSLTVKPEMVAALPADSAAQPQVETEVVGFTDSNSDEDEADASIARSSESVHQTDQAGATPAAELTGLGLDPRRSDSDAVGLVAGDQAGGVQVPGVPKYSRALLPHYPRVARQQGWQGTTVLQFAVSRDGQVNHLRLAQGSGFAILDEAAIEAARKWKFVPASVAAIPSDWLVEVPVTFRLTRTAEVVSR